MDERIESESRKLLGRLRAVLAGGAAGQQRLDQIVRLIAKPTSADIVVAKLVQITTEPPDRE